MSKEIEWVMHVGQPGTGKSFTINQILNSYYDNNYRNVAVIVPTFSAKQNLLKNIRGNQELRKQIDSCIYVKYLPESTNNLSLLIFEEISLLQSTDLHSCLNQLSQQKSPLKIMLFGDALQLQTKFSLFNSITNFNFGMNACDFALQNPYESNVWNHMQVPTIFLDTFIPSDIKVVKHLHNYRFLESDNYSGYNDNLFIDRLINDSWEVVIDSSTSNESNKDLINDAYLKQAVDRILDGSPIISPTNAINKSIEDYFKRYCKENKLNYQEQSLFVRPKSSSKATDIYLNPKYKDLSHLKNDIPGISISHDPNVEYLSANTVHAFQGQTVHSIVYFLGGFELPVNNKLILQHYSFSNFFTAISRSNYYIELIGKKETFRKMLAITPNNYNSFRESRGLALYTANKVVFGLQNETIPNIHYSTGSLYEIYKAMFNENLENLPDVPEHSVILTNRQFCSFFEDYKVKSPNGIDYNYILGDAIDESNRNAEANKKEARVKGGKSSGNGKVQKFINSLDSEQLEQLKSDLSNRKISQDEFYGKYHYSKKTIRQSI